MLTYRGVRGTFKRHRVMQSNSFRVRSHRGTTLINIGNTKGSAVLGVVVKRRPLSNKSIVLTGKGALNCLTRHRSLGSKGAVCRRIGDTGTSVFTVRTRVHSVRRRLGRLRNRRLRDHLRACGHLRSRFSTEGNCTYRDRVANMLGKLKFARSSFGGRASALSKNRGAHISLKGLLLADPSVLLLSRPAGRLSLGSVT